MSPEGQGRAVGDAWEALPEPRPALSLEVWSLDRGQSRYFNLGPHRRACGRKTSIWSTAFGCA